MSKIITLSKQINDARQTYYNTGTPTISDQQFDSLIDELYILDPHNSAIVAIGSEPVSNWEKYTHEVPMGSLNKASTDEEFIKWYQKYLSNTDKCFITTKLDGLSVCLIYVNGILTKAVTRGSGKVGELITANVIKMQGVPLRLKQKINATVRGEILLSKENYKTYFSDYSNARNAASGISRRYDGIGCDKLTVASYQLFWNNPNKLNISTQLNQFQLLHDLDFFVPPFYVFDSIKDAIELKNQYHTSLREKFAFDLDGLVIHNNDLSKQKEFGSLHDRPYASIAWKFDNVHKIGIVSAITNQVGNSGRVVPVATFDPPIKLMGAKVSRATLHNYGNVEELGIDIGAEVLVCRSGDVIPYVKEVVKSTDSIFTRPTECPTCGVALITEGEYLICPNHEGCVTQIAGAIKIWISTLDLLEWGDTLVERLVESDLVKNIDDLYKLSVNDLASIERMGIKSATKCLDILWSKTNISLDTFIGGLNIPLIGVSTVQLLMENGFNTINAFQEASIDDLIKIKGLGPAKASALVNGLQKKQALINALLNKNLISLISNTTVITSNKLETISFCITGSTEMKRDDLIKIIKENGGDFKPTVSKGVQYLIIADPTKISSKTKNAQKFGIKMISEVDFLRMVI